MIIKTPEFDAELKQNMVDITINKKRPFVLKGSYRIKKMGSVITDIDWTAYVALTPKLLEIIANIVNKAKRGKKFYFIHLTCGEFKEIEVPWIINDDGCQFNLDLAKQWFDQFKKTNIVPSEVIEYIRNKLFQSELKVVDLIDIEIILHPYLSIKWKEEDIRKGYIKRGNNTYNLLELMKTQRTVMKYIYLFKDYQFVPMDVGLIDKNYPETQPPQSPMYYREDCYKILKSFKWKLNEKDRDQYFEVMDKVENLISIKYEIQTLKRIISGKVFSTDVINRITNNINDELQKLDIDSKGKKLEQLDLVLYDKVNDILCSYIRYFIIKIKPTEREKVERYFQREIEAQIPTSTEILIERTKRGIRCPFFESDKEINPLAILAIRLGMKPDKVIKCFTSVSKRYKMPVSELINISVGSNDLYLAKFGSQVILYQGDKQVGVFPLDQLTEIQSRVLRENRRIFPSFDPTLSCNV